MISMVENRIDFKEQRTILQNMNRLKRVSKTKSDVPSKMIGLMMMVDAKTHVSFGLRAALQTEAPDQNPVIDVIANFENTQEKYEISLVDVNPENASMMEMFALCSYADHKKITKETAFGTFRELKNWLGMGKNQKISNKGTTYAEFIARKCNWKDIVCMMKKEFLDAGIYYQYQTCLQLLDSFEVFDEMRGHVATTVKKEIQEPNQNKKISRSKAKTKEVDRTAETVMQMIRNESEKYVNVH